MVIQTRVTTDGNNKPIAFKVFSGSKEIGTVKPGQPLIHRGVAFTFDSLMHSIYRDQKPYLEPDAFQSLKRERDMMEHFMRTYMVNHQGNWCSVYDLYRDQQERIQLAIETETDPKMFCSVCHGHFLEVRELRHVDGKSYCPEHFS